MDIPPINSDDIAELSMAGQTFGKAELLCRLAVYSYLNPSELATVMAKAPWTDYEYWDFGENQGFVAWSPHCAVVSFRGTDSVNDWGQNAKVLWPRPHELGGRVHRGFREVSNQAKQRVVEILSSLDAADRHLWLTGHSLGGAVATEFSAHLLVQPIRSLPNWEVTTFGAPRLGDEGFENAYESQIGAGHCESHWWFVNEGDPVPHLPPKFFGYLHCGRLFWFDKTGKLIPVDEREVGLQAAKAGENA
ncbi:MAG: lipase family protein, partial [Pseudomonadota bacterium]